MLLARERLPRAAYFLERKGSTPVNQLPEGLYPRSELAVSGKQVPAVLPFVNQTALEYSQSLASNWLYHHAPIHESVTTVMSARRFNPSNTLFPPKGFMIESSRSVITRHACWDKHEWVPHDVSVGTVLFWWNRFPRIRSGGNVLWQVEASRVTLPHSFTAFSAWNRNEMTLWFYLLEFRMKTPDIIFMFRYEYLQQLFMAAERGPLPNPWGLHIWVAKTFSSLTLVKLLERQETSIGTGVPG